jgi:hypothetical protein
MIMSNTTLEILKRVRNRLATPERWTHGWYAKSDAIPGGKDSNYDKSSSMYLDGAVRRNMAGFCVEYDSSDAVCWCLMGAIKVEALKLVGRGLDFEEVQKVDKLLCSVHGMDSSITFNDSHTHEDVIYVLDATISRFSHPPTVIL